MSAKNISIEASKNNFRFVLRKSITAIGKVSSQKKAAMCGSGKKATARMSVSPEMFTSQLGKLLTASENETPKKNGAMYSRQKFSTVFNPKRNCAKNCARATHAETAPESAAKEKIVCALMRFFRASEEDTKNNGKIERRKINFLIAHAPLSAQKSENPARMKNVVPNQKDS